jgi:hypothetical protein
LLEVLFVLTLFPLALQRAVGLDPELFSGRAVALGVAGGELFYHGGGEAHVGQGQHRAGTAAQNIAYLGLCKGQFQPQHASRLAKMSAPAAGIGGRVAG